MYYNIDLIGYVGMLFVVLSFVFTNIKYIRTFNIIGALFSAAYGSLTGTSATTLLNIVLIVINALHLINSFRKKSR